mgnify:FL=1
MKHSFSSNIKFLIKNWFKKDSFGTILVFLSAIVTIIIPLFDAYILKTITAAIIEGLDAEQFILSLIGLFIFYILLKILYIWMDTRNDFFQTKVSMLYGVDLISALMDKDLLDFKTAEQKSLFERSKSFAFEGEQADGAWSAIRLSNLITSFLGFFAYAIIFSFLSYKLVLIILISALITAYFQDRLMLYGDAITDEMAKEESRHYYMYKVSLDDGAQKEIRLNNALSWLVYHLDKISNAYYSLLRGWTKKANAVSLVEGIFGFIRDLFTYVLLTKSVLNGEISAANFIFYLSLVVGFSEWLNNFSGHIRSLRRISLVCDKYRTFVQDKADLNTEKIILKSIDEIKLEDVSFAYDEDNEILKNINLTIKKGESIAIVGENGAGKTTLIKLITKLFDASSGRILINGIDIDLYDKKSVYKRISALFQDYFLMPTTLINNLDDKQQDRLQAEKFIDEMGLSNRVTSLENGLDTELINIEDNKVEGFSGGETQKLLFIKSLMKDSDLLILDEPTSALDPIAEEKLYLKYKDFTEDKMAIFISHRITSTRFCDRIIYLDDKSIAELGTYDELMNLGGKYKAMFDMQAKYYKENENEEASL